MAKKTIFVVDDEPLIARLAQVNLEYAGYDVVMAHDGVEALNVLQSGQIKPDLILLDIMMPYMDGFEFLSRLKECPPLDSIPVIIMTARSHDREVAATRSVGSENYLTKPISPTDLLNTVQKALGDLPTVPEKTDHAAN